MFDFVGDVKIPGLILLSGIWLFVELLVCVYTSDSR